MEIGEEVSEIERIVEEEIGYYIVVKEEIGYYIVVKEEIGYIVVKEEVPGNVTRVLKLLKMVYIGMRYDLVRLLTEQEWKSIVEGEDGPSAVFLTEIFLPLHQQLRIIFF